MTLTSCSCSICKPPVPVPCPVGLGPRDPNELDAVVDCVSVLALDLDGVNPSLPWISCLNVTTPNVCVCS